MSSCGFQNARLSSFLNEFGQHLTPGQPLLGLSTIYYAFMQTLSMTNDHLVDYFRYAEIARPRHGRAEVLLRLYHASNNVN